MSNPLPNPSVIRLPLLLLVLFVTHPACSEIVSLTMDSGLEATAELLGEGSEETPLLILHGFLQTRNFFTVRRLAEALHDDGYTVLLPNLTLGVDHRRQSLACEAIHTHSMEQDVEELSVWVDWLHHRTGKPVTLIGHSVGSLMILAYLCDRSPRQIDQALLISLIPFVQGPIAKESEADRQRASRQLKLDPKGLASYPLAFCDTYATNPENYLSYLHWDSKKTLHCLNKMPHKPTVILGGGDQRLGENWMPMLRDTGTEIIEIDGANHFFTDQYEFDLVDTISELLQRSKN